jgi:hypothetical protein
MLASFRIESNESIAIVNENPVIEEVYIKSRVIDLSPPSASLPLICRPSPSPSNLSPQTVHCSFHQVKAKQVHSYRYHHDERTRAP